MTPDANIFWNFSHQKKEFSSLCSKILMEILKSHAVIILNVKQA